MDAKSSAIPGPSYSGGERKGDVIEGDRTDRCNPSPDLPGDRPMWPMVITVFQTLNVGDREKHRNPKFPVTGGSRWLTTQR